MYMRKAYIDPTLTKSRLVELEELANTWTFSHGDVLDTAKELWCGIDSPVSLACFLLAKYGEYEQLVSKAIKPSDYSNADVFAIDYQAVSFVKKMPFEIAGIDRSRTCFLAVKTAERICERTNDAFYKLSTGSAYALPGLDVLYTRVRGFIANVLGRFSPEEWEESCRFGPGAAAYCQGTTPYEKLQGRPTVTGRFAPFGAALVNASPAWRQAITNIGTCPLGDVPEIPLVTLDVVPGGKYTTVPKTALTDRPIEVQPLVNLYAQSGIGLMIRRRLARAGNSIKSQVPNQRLARYGSITNAVSTIDLQSASDTLATEFVRYVLPSDWFYAMDVCRTTSMNVSGVEQPLHRFSSMGNGFTFELETLIFWAIAECCRSNDVPRRFVRAFGDDITCASKDFELTTSVLRASGFVVNKAKSFNSGPFRESCGKDFFLGTEVRPYFFKGDLDEDNHFFLNLSMANGLRRAARRRNLSFGCDRRFKRAWVHCFSRTPASLRLTGPEIEQLPGVTVGDAWFLDGESKVGDLSYWDRDLFRARWLSFRLVSRGLTAVNWNAAKAHMLYTLERGPTLHWSETVPLLGGNASCIAQLAKPYSAEKLNLRWELLPFESIDRSALNWV